MPVVLLVYNTGEIKHVGCLPEGYQAKRMTLEFNSDRAVTKFMNKLFAGTQKYSFVYQVR